MAGQGTGIGGGWKSEIVGADIFVVGFLADLRVRANREAV